MRIGKKWSPTDIVDLAREERAGFKDGSVADVQAAAGIRQGNICVFGDKNVVYVEPAIRAITSEGDPMPVVVSDYRA